MSKLLAALAFAGAAALMLSAPARAVVYTGSGTIGGNSVDASATFAISGNVLTITLQNTSPANAMETPTNTLSGVSFLLNGLSPTLTTVSAISPNAIFDSAACDVNPCTGTNVNVGGEWGYQPNFTDAVHGITNAEGIGSAGYITTGLPMDLGNFNGVDLQSPASLDGINFAILSATHGALNGGLTGEALIDDTVVLTLNGVSGITESEIGGVNFLYGTAPDDTVAGTCIPGSPGCGSGPPIPEPSALALVGSALFLLGVMWRRKSV
jgi:hypothetical protein